MSAYSEFYFKPARGEHIVTAVHMEPEGRCAIHGTVLDPRGKPVEGALALLFRVCGEEEEPRAVSQFFTGADGRFFFGPLPPDTLFLMRLFKDEVKLRELELRTD